MRDLFTEEEAARRWLFEHGTHWRGQTEVHFIGGGMIKLESLLADFAYDRSWRGRIKEWIRNF